MLWQKYSAMPLIVRSAGLFYRYHYPNRGKAPLPNKVSKKPSKQTEDFLISDLAPEYGAKISSFIDK